HPSEYSDVAFTQIGNKVIHIVSKEVDLPDNDTIKMITLKDLTSIKIIDQQYKKHKKYAENNSKYSFGDIVHKSRAMTNTIAKAKHFARSDSTILITGESGVGKELIAQSIHNASARGKYPFIAINCAALSDTLLESELFGYEEGAFTGARKGGKKGLFELADDGTIFLDEIGDAPLSIQQKLLRVLQEKEIMRVAGDKIIAVNVRVITATNKDLVQHVERGLFRSDLYYRLNVLPLSIPSLRERKEDIEILLRYLINKHGYHDEIIFDKKILDMLVGYSWPGNVRELENIAEYIATIAGVSDDLQCEIAQYLTDKKRGASANGKACDWIEPFYFRDSGIKSELKFILRQLCQARDKHVWIGRFKLREALEKDNLYLTEPQIKNRLNLLKKEQLIVCHNGKGSIITDKGVAYLGSSLADV
ncbi:MAG TPA: sigma 54-interacting transcriptional regulator, partial [Negativicutes bacterium]|nr:sigma 54-interacting transcriptional regulator [Negativicutes bacterium]